MKAETRRAAAARHQRLREKQAERERKAAEVRRLRGPDPPSQHLLRIMALAAGVGGGLDAFRP